MDKRVFIILNELNNLGYDAYIVGGYVRDYLLKKISYDYDICTNASIDVLKSVFSKYKYNIKYLTFEIFFDNIIVEITPYRKELSYNKRKPDNYLFVDKLDSDIIRRDFTINTICMDKDKNIIDLLNGLSDIHNKVIRCVGEVEKKIIEDPLRILRALRFSAYLNFDIEESLYSAIKKYSYLLKDISYEVKKREIDKLIGIKRLDILKCVENDLQLDLSNIKYYNDSILTWFSIDKMNKYCISRYEKKLRNSIDKLLNSKLDNYDIYLAGYDIVYLCNNIIGVDIISKYNNLLIKSRKDINISSMDIYQLLGTYKVINKAYIMIEKAILNDIIKNDRIEILSYLTNNKDCLFN